MAIESTTRSNRNLLSEMAAEYRLHSSFVALLHRLNAEQDSESVCLSLKLIIRLLRRQTDAEFDFFQLQFAGIFTALASFLSQQSKNTLPVRLATKTLKYMTQLDLVGFDRASLEHL